MPPAQPPDPPAGIDFAAELNAGQLAAATAEDGPHLVVAGAGSGKTRTLVYRVAYLVERGVAPESILLLTFTRRAARQMLYRASRILDERCRRVAGGTFHSFANAVLRRHAKRLGYGDRFTILDRSDSADLVGVLRSEEGLDRQGRRFPRKDTLLELFSKQVNTGRPLPELIEDAYPQFLDDLDDVEGLRLRYRERKREQNVMDYDDLLVNLRDLLRDHEAVRRRLSSTYRHLLVDEYQDTNRLQAHIVALLAADHGNVMVVGDDAQSIYSFRGAELRNILDFPEIFPNARVTVLEQNYRSTQPVLDLGNAILEHAREKYSKRLFTEREGGELPVLMATADDFSQAEFIAHRVLELREEGIALNEIAVLARAAWHTNNLEVELNHRNIPFRKFGGLRLVEAAHVKDLCALLKVATNRLDAAAWFRFLQLFDGIGPATAQKLAAAVVTGGGDLGALRSPELARRRYGDELARLAHAVDYLGSEELELGARVEAASDYYRVLMPKKYDDVQRRMRDIEALAVIAERYQDVDAFLSDLAIDPPDASRAAADDGEDEWMTLSTVHSAKGLEWHTVFILQLTQGQLPSFRSLRDADDLEEERRLFYVAVTRARHNLYLMQPEQLPRGGLAEASAFLTEIDELDRLVERRTFQLPDDDAGAGSEAPAADEAAPESDARLARIRDYFGGG